MKDIIIVGAGGLGREVLQWIKDINKVNPTWNIKGFIDDNADALNGIECDKQVIGKISNWQPSENEVFAMAIASPVTKRDIANTIMSRGGEFATIIHPRALISEFAEYGKGLVMYPGARLSPNAKLGDFVTLLDTGIGHDAIVDDYATVCAGCAITRSVHIKEGAFIGANACISPEKKIGKYAFVGIGSVVIMNVSDGKKVFGNPARTVK